MPTGNFPQGTGSIFGYITSCPRDGSRRQEFLLDTKKTGVPISRGYIPTIEVSDLDKFTKEMKKKGVKLGERILEGDDVRLIDFYDPNGRPLQAFQFKHKSG